MLGQILSALLVCLLFNFAGSTSESRWRDWEQSLVNWAKALMTSQPTTGGEPEPQTANVIHAVKCGRIWDLGVCFYPFWKQNTTVTLPRKGRSAPLSCQLAVARTDHLHALEVFQFWAWPRNAPQLPAPPQHWHLCKGSWKAPGPVQHTCRHPASMANVLLYIPQRAHGPRR